MDFSSVYLVCGLLCDVSVRVMREQDHQSLTEAQEQSFTEAQPSGLSPREGRGTPQKGLWLFYSVV